MEAQTESKFEYTPAFNRLTLEKLISVKPHLKQMTVI